VGALALLAAERLALWEERESTPRLAASWAGIGLGAAGVFASALQISPPADSAIGAIWASRTIGERLGIAVSSLVHGFAPVPWPNPLARAGLGWLHVLQIVAGVAFTAVFVVTAGLTLARRRLAWIAAAFPVTALLLFFYFRYYGGARHAGFMLVATVIALWLAPSFTERALGVGRLARSSAEAERLLAPIFTATLAFHLVGAAIATGVDVRYVFSAAPATAALIREQGLADLPIVADPDWAASNVIAQLGKPGAYYANVDRWGSFMVQDDRHGRGGRYARAPSDEFVFARAASLARGTDVVVLLNREARAETLTRAGAALVGYRLSDVFQDESFWVYLVPAGKQETAAFNATAPAR
jgi:hypothetical protein